MKKTHEYYMRMALRLALKAKGRTSSNPLVGALVVKNHRVVGRGFHEQAGKAHAEVMALEEAGKKSRGATLYVTLEPCMHFGRTPPCVDRIIVSGIKEVVVGMIDPNPVNNGRGIAKLRQHSIGVTVGVLEQKLRAVNEAFVKYITTGLPLVTVKVAQSLDGKIATKTGDSKWITSDESRAWAHRIRSEYDAIMVGVNTVLRDNPKLDAWFSDRHPVKIVVDSQLSTPQDARIFADGRTVIIATLASRPGQEIENRGILSSKAQILEVREKVGQVNLKDLLLKLGRMGIMTLIVEGGGSLIGSLFDEGLVDKVMFFVSPKVIGGKEALGSVMGKGITRLEQAIKLKDVALRRIGDDFLFEGHVK